MVLYLCSASGSNVQSYLVVTFFSRIPFHSSNEYLIRIK
jgi:hypothetical protein